MSKQSPAQADRREQQASGTWQWGSTPKTRQVLLDAARQVFAEQGFSQTSIADVVERAVERRQPVPPLRRQERALPGPVA